MIRLRGVVSETVSSFRWIHRLRTFVYWDAPSTSIECRIQYFDYRASLASTHACFFDVSRLRGEASKIIIRGSPALAVL